MIYIAHGFDLARLAEPLSHWLSDGERAQLEGYTSLARQRQYLVGRGLLRWLACTETGCAQTDVNIAREPSGAPRLTIAEQPFACSISHKDNAVMVAYGAVDALGVDIEAITIRKRQRDLLGRFRQGFLRDVAEQDQQLFYQRWTLAEAVTKAEQGKLLATLRRPFTAYQHHAVFRCEQAHELCCYSPQLKLTGDNLRWWRAGVESGMLRRDRVDI